MVFFVFILAFFIFAMVLFEFTMPLPVFAMAFVLKTVVPGKNVSLLKNTSLKMKKELVFAPMCIVPAEKPLFKQWDTQSL